ncbi:T6SS component Hcp [Burkholderia anthina]|nr:T6SS component Hcp [Burkholderia anthina]
MTWRRFGLVAGMLAVVWCLSACGKSEPVYSGVSVIAHNYLPYNLDGFSITDAYGNKALGGNSLPGGGGGVTCCYKLEGTEFVVKWSYVDVDQWHKGNEETLHAEATVAMLPTRVPEKIGDRIIEVHFYPDRHVELQFPGALVGTSRIPMIDVSRWMSSRYQNELNRRYDEREDQQFRRIVRVVAMAWLKYRLTDLDDLKQYAYYDLLVNSRFDSHPAVQHVLQTAAGKPGMFAKSMRSLPKGVWSALVSDSFAPVAVPVVPDGLLPPPRVPEVLHG